MKHLFKTFHISLFALRKIFLFNWKVSIRMFYFICYLSIHQNLDKKDDTLICLVVVVSRVFILGKDIGSDIKGDIGNFLGSVWGWASSFWFMSWFACCGIITLKYNFTIVFKTTSRFFSFFFFETLEVTESHVLQPIWANFSWLQPTCLHQLLIELSLTVGRKLHMFFQVVFFG